MIIVANIDDIDKYEIINNFEELQKRINDDSKIAFYIEKLGQTKTIDDIN